jgi:hypothetical protein
MVRDEAALPFDVSYAKPFVHFLGKPISLPSKGLNMSMHLRFEMASITIEKRLSYSIREGILFLAANCPAHHSGRSKQFLSISPK